MVPASRSLMHDVSRRRRWRCKIAIRCGPPAFVSAIRKLSLSFRAVDAAPIIRRRWWSAHAGNMAGRSHSQAPMTTISTRRVCGWWGRRPSDVCISCLGLERILPRKAVQGNCLTCFNVFPSQAMVTRKNSLFHMVCIFLLGPLCKPCGFDIVRYFLDMHATLGKLGTNHCKQARICLLTSSSLSSSCCFLIIGAFSRNA